MFGLELFRSISLQYRLRASSPTETDAGILYYYTPSLNLYIFQD
jgi:hypothetical protein